MYVTHSLRSLTTALSETHSIFRERAGRQEHILHIKNTLIIRAAISRILTYGIGKFGKIRRRKPVGWWACRPCAMRLCRRVGRWTIIRTVRQNIIIYKTIIIPSIINLNNLWSFPKLNLRQKNPPLWSSPVYLMLQQAREQWKVQPRICSAQTTSTIAIRVLKVRMKKLKNKK